MPAFYHTKLTNNIFVYLQGHDNFGHNIPELLKRNPTSDSVISPQNSSALSSLHLNHFHSNQPEIMSPLPMHNRPLMGRRIGLGVDALLWIFCKFFGSIFSNQLEITQTLNAFDSVRNLARCAINRIHFTHT